MKRNFKLLIFIGIVFSFVSCGSKGPKTVEDYIREANTAMNEGNFAEAYTIVDILNNTETTSIMGVTDYSYKKAAKELNSKIVNNEIASLFENPQDPLIGSKISKILKERFPKAHETKSGFSNDELENVKNCLILAIDLSIEIGKEDLVSKLITQIPIRGERKEGLQGYYYGSGDLDYKYLPDCAEYNKICDQSLDKAIQAKKYEIAQEIIDLYKEDSEVTLGGHWYDDNGTSHNSRKVNGIDVDGNHSYVSYNWKSKEAAKKKLAEARKG